MTPTHQLMQAAVPTRHEKRRVARALGISSESLFYAFCEDPDGSGRPNPIDKIEVILDHALVHHPDAALAIVQRLEARCVHALSARATALPLADLLVSLQPDAEREAMDTVRAFSTAIRQVVLGGDCDRDALLQEITEAERELKRVGVMLRAAIEADPEASHA
ncbi:MAG TPA: hypothetical protein VF615_25670 [Longimicrobiaceae bacterium]|jgi:hypothetical protein